ncbi:MAG: Ig-like domain-containing protein [Chloroflexota bacterium]
MKSLKTIFRTTIRLLAGVLSVLVMLWPFGAVGAAPARQGPPAAALTIVAPAAVPLGERIELQLIVDHAQDLAGYEAQLLFDTAAAHFSGLHQRDSDFKKFGRDIIPLEATELPDGVAMGLASCKFADCVQPGGRAPVAKGANGRVRIATVVIGTDQEGALELSLENTRFVDSQGSPLAVEILTPKVIVQVGQANADVFPAPKSRYEWTASAPAQRALDLSQDGQLGYADAMEAATEWKLSREAGQPCGPANDLSRDTNGDGCLDVADVQLVLAMVQDGTAAPAAAPAAGPGAANPAATEPVATEPSAIDPAATEPAVTEPAATNPAVTEPIAIEPAVTEPSAIDPAATDPAVIEPAPEPPAETVSPDPAAPVDAAAAAPDAIQAAAALNFVVTSTSDLSDSNIGDGRCASNAGCTLRAAIQEANKHQGPDTIFFNISGSGIQTIQLNSRLPALSDGSGGTTINGYTQPGAQANTSAQASNAQIRVEIRGKGSSSFDLLQILSANNRVQGLSFFNGRRSIWLYGKGSRNNVIVGNFIGTDAAGSFRSTTHTLYASGVAIDSGASANQVGGTGAANRNVISGNARHGVEFHSDGSDNNVVINNLIGTNPAGNARLMNLRHGIDVNSGASYNIFGGSSTGERNIISGNGELQNDTFTAGIEISHDTLTGYNQVLGNCFGTDVTCNSAPSWAYNSHYGIRMEDGVNNNIVAGNVIVNSRQGGIRMTGSGSNRNQMYNNRIGVTLNGTAAPNGNFGIQISNASKFGRIGPNNIIANNPVGIQLMSAGDDQHTITRNSIYNNNRLGIDLGTISGVTPNDSSDSDSGSNQELNFPVLTSAATGSVSGTACATSNVSKPCTIEIFIAERKTSDSGAGNYGQGKTFVGSGTTNSNGAFTISISGVSIGQYLTATATDASGNTSEFARNIQVSTSGSGSGGGGVPVVTSRLYLPTVLGGSGANGGSYAPMEVGGIPSASIVVYAAPAAAGDSKFKPL